MVSGSEARAEWDVTDSRNRDDDFELETAGDNLALSQEEVCALPCRAPCLVGFSADIWPPRVGLFPCRIVVVKFSRLLGGQQSVCGY